MINAIIGSRICNLVKRTATSPNNTPQADAGVLGKPGTQVLFGDGSLFGTDRSGGRVRLGVWLGNDQDYAVEGEYFALGDGSLQYGQQSSGDPILARPFFNVLTGQQDSQLVAYPGVLAGTVTVNASTALQSAGIDLRAALWVQEVGGLNSGVEKTQRVSLLMGYRYLRLDEGLAIHEDLTSLNPFAPGTFGITDSFNTGNAFQGGEIGVLFRQETQRWSLESRCKLGLGCNHETVDIFGSTVTQSGGVTTPYTGGLLAQRTNIGRYSQDEFALVPEVGINLGYRLTDHVQVIVGYSFIYWSRVARPGDQIDTRVNPNLLPPETVPFTGPLNPAFAFQQNDYWLQGVNFGVDCRW